MNRKPVTLVLALTLFMAAYWLGMSSPVTTERTARAIPQAVPQSMLAKGDGTAPPSKTFAPITDAGLAGQVLLYEPARSNNTKTILDDLTGNDVGKYTSITIGSDGLPLISYRDQTANRLKVAHCNDIACTGATISTINTPSQHTSITLGADGLGVISLYDPVVGSLKVAHCSNLLCTTSTVATVEAFGAVGMFNAIAIDRSGRPIISYYDAGNGDLKLAICANTLCSSATLITLDSDNNVGQFTSLAINNNTDALISYYDVTGANLMLINCHINGITCSIKNRTTLDSLGTVGLMSSIAIGEDGKAIISYYDQSDERLNVAHCKDSDCTNTDVKVASEGVSPDDGINSSIAIGLDGRPVISSFAQDRSLLLIDHCFSIDCSEGLDGQGLDLQNAGSNTSITIGVDGMPIISYYDIGNHALKTIHCGSPGCTPFQRRR
jgi:hypothetical protein